MDRLRRFVAWSRLKWRVLKNRLWYNEPEADYFRFVDIISVVGGIYYEPEKIWQKICWRWYRRLAHVVSLIFLTTAAENIQDDLIAMSWFAVSFILMTTAYVKEFILRSSIDTIQNVQACINAKSNASNNPQHDSMARRKFFQTSQTASLGLLAVIVLSVLCAPFIAIQQERFFILPRFLRSSNSIVNETLCTLYLMTFFMIWAAKIHNAIVQATALFAGFRSELEILAHEFDDFLDLVRSDAEMQPSQAFWENINQTVKYFIEKHNEYLINQRRLGDLLGKCLFFTYYQDVVVIGSFLFVMLKEGYSSGSIIYALGIAVLLIECYWWCRLGEFFHDIIERIELIIMDLMVAIPHSKEHHSNYVQLRTALMIMKINFRNSSTFNCVGIFDISVEVFTQLLNISYSVVTFLLNVAL